MTEEQNVEAEKAAAGAPQKHYAANCGNCPMSNPGIRPGGVVDFTNRICRADPPRVMLLPLALPNGKQSTQLRTVYPQVHKTNDLCWRHPALQAALAQWQPKPEDIVDAPQIPPLAAVNGAAADPAAGEFLPGEVEPNAGSAVEQGDGV